MKIQHLLFVELLGGIGDMLIALPAIHALARSHPTAHLTVLTFAPGDELLQTDPLIHRVIQAQRDHPHRSLTQLLTEQSFDLIVSDTRYDGIAEVLQNSAAHTIVTNLWRSPPPDQRVGDRFLEILQQEGLIVPESTVPHQPHLHLTEAEKSAAQSQLGAAYRPLVFLIPDAGMPIKRWPADRFVALGKTLQQRYGATPIVVAGGDLQSAEQMQAAIAGNAQLWQLGLLRHLAAGLSTADLVVAADTGPARIAAALHIPTVTLFGPSWHSRYGQPAPHINLQGFPACSERKIHNFTEQPCWYGNTCPFDWQTCLEDIPVAAVLQACDRLLSPPPPSPLPINLHHPSPVTRHPSSFILHPSSFILNSPLPPLPSLQNLLLLRLDNIGDVIMTTPALRSLRENLPNARITLLASPGGVQTAPLLPWVDEVLPWRVLWQDLGRLAFDPQREWQLVELLRSRQFDAAIIFTSFSQSPHPAGFLCALAGIPLRLGESKEHDGGTLTHPISPAPDKIHQVERNLRLIEAAGFTVSNRSLTLAIPPQARQRVRQWLGDVPYLVLNPWTSCPSRNYDAKRFAIAAKKLHQITSYPVVVTGIEKDRDRAQDLLRILGEGAIDRIGQTELVELVALVDQAKLVLTNNTSTLHIADATRTPSVILFAGTEYESQWYPRHSASRLLRRSTVCSPCYAFTCSHDLECLDISPEAVVAAGLELLQQQSPI